MIGKVVFLLAGLLMILTCALENKDSLKLSYRSLQSHATDENHGLSKRLFESLILLYIKRYSFCCNGTNYNYGPYPVSYDCCNTQLYDSSTSRCCNGVVKQLSFVNMGSQCCGANLFDPKTSMCCDGQTYPIKKNVFVKCCGTKSYDPLKEVCCKKSISPLTSPAMLCCDAKAYDPTTSVCMSDNTVKAIPAGITTAKACGTTIIDYRKQICCKGTTPHNLESNFTLCCGTEAFNAVTQICCNEVIVSDPNDGSRCCDKKLYKPKQEICCNGTIIPRPSNNLAKTDFCHAAPASAFYNSNNQCCGNKLYSFKVGGNFNCCGNALYDKNKQTCCNQAIINGYQQPCCGSTTVGLLQRCCNQKVSSIFVPLPNTCCCGSTFCADGAPYEPISVMSQLLMEK